MKKSIVAVLALAALVAAQASAMACSLTGGPDGGKGQEQSDDGDKD